VVLMADRSHHLSDAEVLSVPAFAGTPAAASGRLIRMSGGYLLNFGPRTAHAARDLAAAVYPELAFPELPARPWTADAPPGQ
jgi:iron complex transport system substrate-binding protein